jgi:hypothetical protein
MREIFTAAGGALILVLLALVPSTAAAQSLQANPFDRSDAPAQVLGFSGAQVEQLNREFQDDLYALDAFGGRRRVDRFALKAPIERAMPWKFYGRLGPLNFQNQLEPQPQGFQFSWRRTGPSLGGKVYLGFHRTFN